MYQVFGMNIDKWPLFPCGLKEVSGIDCPTCGFQRSLIFLLEGDFYESFKMFPPLLPSIVMIIFFFLHLIDRKIISRKLIWNYGAILLVIIGISYIIKMLTQPEAVHFH